jgi:hypothetical protein
MEQLYGVAVVPLLLALMEIVKGAGLNPKYAGLVSWALGVALAFAYGLTEAGWTILQCSVIGSAIGLSASGLYSGVKNTSQAMAERAPQDGSDKNE